MTGESPRDWHAFDSASALRSLECDVDRGLSKSAVESRRREFGENALAQSEARGPWAILREQFASALVVLLLVAAIVSAGLGELADCIAIVAIVLLNAALGYAQDARAERAIAALKALAVPLVTVRREGGEVQVSSRELVPGDLLVLENGDMVAADGRLIHSTQLRTQEAALTGESTEVEKEAGRQVDRSAAVADRVNMVFSGTAVVNGRAEAVVTATGMATELGQVAAMLGRVVRQPTPLQRRLSRFGRRLAVAALAIVAVVFALGLLRGESSRTMFLTALSLAVAAVPEGLPAVATVALAMGARRLLKRRSLIRKLPAVETLGSVTVICSDKTGTLTQNRMSVERAITASEISPESDAVSASAGETDDSDARGLLLACVALCNNAKVTSEDLADSRSVVGQPTEIALATAAVRSGLGRDELERVLPRRTEIPFDSQRKRMTTVHDVLRIDALPPSLGPLSSLLSADHTAGRDSRVAFSKGAISSLLEVSSFSWSPDGPVPLTESIRRRVLSLEEELALGGMRVLGAALRVLDESERDDESVEREYIFLGAFGIADPPRPEAASAVERCRGAGIRVVMITGDHPLTARAIGRQVGVESEVEPVTGAEIDALDDDELRAAVKEVSLWARVAPGHKLRLVEALQAEGHVVAMTGDGVNDAPALKQADIGVAMGITGTDVSKEAAEMVLVDDNFSTIVEAVEEGRNIFDNIRKFIRYTMTSNAGEIFVMMPAPLFGLPLPLLPLQILWVNLVTDGLPGLALSVEPGEAGLMERKPRPPREGFLSGDMGVSILWVGLLMGIVALGVGFAFRSDEDAATERWRTAVFTVLTLSQMGNALAVRSERQSIFRLGLFSNLALVGAVALTFALQLLVIYAPPLQGVLHTVPLTLAELAGCVAASTLVFWAVELRKWFSRCRAES